MSTQYNCHQPRLRSQCGFENDCADQMYFIYDGHDKSLDQVLGVVGMLFGPRLNYVPEVIANRV